MATAPFRSDLLKSIQGYDEDMHRTASDMRETVIKTREIVEVSRNRIWEADRLLKRLGAEIGNRGHIQCQLDRILLGASSPLKVLQP